jgi:hypothetical protein
MKYLMIVMLLVGCASNPMQNKRDRVLDCTKELIEMDSSTEGAYKVCKDLYTRKEEK